MGRREKREREKERVKGERRAERVVLLPIPTKNVHLQPCNDKSPFFLFSLIF
jgi:hypothetical protein